jgi:hypothetical protein
MNDRALKEALNDQIFPGNSEAFYKLASTLQKGEMLAFVGAGASAPLFPTWGSLLHKLLDEAQKNGFFTSDLDADFLRAQISGDPLEAANFLENVLSKQIFRSKLAEIFLRDPHIYTESHKLIVSMGFRGIVTLNYDLGLENAYSGIVHKRPDSMQAKDVSDMTRWLQGASFGPAKFPILHLHGTLSSPEHIVFTSDDYNRFYSQNDKLAFITQLWRSDRLLAIGFGFSDPFLTMLAERTLRFLPTDTRHFAIIGKPEPATSGLIRQQFARKYKLEPIFYQIREGDNETEDHSDLHILLEALSPVEPATVEQLISTTTMRAPTKSSLTTQSTNEAVEQPASFIAQKEFDSHLFVAPLNGRLLYVEPKLIAPAPEIDQKEFMPEEACRFSIEDLVQSNDSYIISALPEYGLTSLCRRILKEFRSKNIPAFFRDSNELPNYKIKLQTEFPDSASVHNNDTILILDNFNLDRHERLIKELVGLGYFGRYVICMQNRSDDLLNGLDVDSFPIRAKVLTLSNLDRSDIRTLSGTMFDTSDDDFVSMIVDRVYGDLLDLCIPLTPSNVIMYLTILQKEGDFQPLNRIQIVERYISQLLRRPGDIYEESFNVKNKTDVISAFVHTLWVGRKAYATEQDWHEFCRSYKRKLLIEFDERKLIQDLLATRLLISYDGNLYFKYRLFYSYFLGSYVANRPKVLAEVMKGDAYLSTNDLVEVISGLGIDNTNLIEDLTAKLERAIEAFDTNYMREVPDPFLKVEWPIGTQDEDTLWRPLAEQLGAGPKAPVELDRIKRSLLSEKRTEDQLVTIRTFEGVERDLKSYLYSLISALKSSDSLDGALKKRSVEAALQGFYCIYQAGLIYSPLIAQHRAYIWNGFAFINAMRFEEKGIEDTDKRTFMVMLVMARAVAEEAVRIAGSRKLGEVYKVLAGSDRGADFRWYLNYVCVLRSKPRLWSETAKDIIAKTDRKSFYMRSMLLSTVKQFLEEVNTGRDREELKRVVATIRVKRELGNKNPASGVVNRALAQLEKKNYFDPMES